MKFTKYGNEESPFYLPHDYYRRDPEKKPRGIDRPINWGYIGMTGRDFQGNVVSEDLAYPRFLLLPEQRLEIYKKQSAVFSVISNRAGKIGGLEFKVVTKRADEDRQIQYMRMAKQIRDEYLAYDGDDFLTYRMSAKALEMELHKQLPTLLPDLSNFDRALIRWRTMSSIRSSVSTSEIEDRLAKPNKKEGWEDFIKKYVVDFLLHGSAALFKKFESHLVESLHILPGGTVYPVSHPTVNNDDTYIQFVVGIEPQVMTGYELCVDNYLPNSMTQFGMVPLDALVVEVSTLMLSAGYQAGRADGSTLPSKVVLFGSGPGIDEIGEARVDNVMDPQRKKRFESQIQQMIKGGILAITGVGTPHVLDLSQDSMSDFVIEYSKELKKMIGLAFGASAMEMNETGSDSTSGRSTSESEERIDMSRAIYPMVKSIESTMTRGVLPQMGGENCLFQLQTGSTEREEMQRLKEMFESGLHTPNEIRQNEMNLEPREGGDELRGASTINAGTIVQNTEGLKL